MHDLAAGAINSHIGLSEFSNLNRPNFFSFCFGFKGLLVFLSKLDVSNNSSMPCIL